MTTPRVDPLVRPPAHRADDGGTFEQALRIVHAGRAPDLATRLARSDAAARRAALDKAAAAGTRRPSPLWAAALVLLGVGVVAFAISRSAAREDVSAVLQDPQPSAEVFADSWLELLQTLCTAREVKVHGRFYDHHNETTLKLFDVADLHRVIDAERTAEWIAAAVAQGQGYRAQDIEAMTEADAAAVAEAVAASAGTIRRLDHIARLEIAVDGGTLEARFVSDGAFGVLSWDGLGSLWMPIEAGGMDGLLTELDQRRREICSVATSAADLTTAPRTLRQLICTPDAVASLADNLDRFERLTHLRVEAAVDDELLAAIGAIATLQDLTLVTQDPTELALDSLHACRELRGLRLERYEFDPSTLAVFDQLRNLQLIECRLLGPGMAMVATLPLEDLDLRIHGIEARDVEAFARMRNLDRLTWTEGRADIARAGVRAIVAAGSVRRLELIVPREVELPELLQGLVSLRVLNVSEIPDSAERTAALRAALPGVHLILP